MSYHVRDIKWLVHMPIECEEPCSEMKLCMGKSGFAQTGTREESEGVRARRRNVISLTPQWRSRLWRLKPFQWRCFTLQPLDSI